STRPSSSCCWSGPGWTATTSTSRRSSVTTYDPTKVRVRDGWCVVKMEPRKVELSSGIVLPPSETGAEKVDSGCAVVVRVGEGQKNRTLGLENGMRVALRSYLKH